ncbi:TPA: hypothetical protein ACHKUB_000369 [Escherichia coli]
MMTFTREQLATLREASEAAKEKTTWQSLQAFRAAATPEVVLALLDVLDASREAEPVAWKAVFTQVDQESNTFIAMYSDKAEVERWVRLHEIGDFRAEITPLYAAPVVPEEISTTHTMLPAMNDQLMAFGYVKGWNACRAAMLKGGA